MNWPLVKLGELVDIKGGGTPSKQVEEYWNGNIPWASVKDFKGSLIAKTQDYITREGVENSATNIIPAGTLIVPTRMALGKVALTGCDMAINQDVKALLIKDKTKLSTDYLLRFLENSSGFIEAQGRGATVKGIKLEVLRELAVPLPLLAEQKRIAAILDKADQLRQKRQQAIALADDFLRSVFLDMFGDPVTNPKGLKVVSLLDLCSKVTDGTHQSPKWEDSGVPFLFISNIVDGQINYETSKFISTETYKELTKTAPIEKGDILYTTVGSYGNVAIVNGDREFCFQRHIAHIKPDHSIINTEFLAGMLSSSPIKRQADKLVRGVAQKTLNLRELKSIQVFDVPIEEQMSYLARVNPMSSVKSKYQHAILESVLCFNAISQKAFAGDL